MRDAELVARAREGDLGAFDRLVQRYREAMVLVASSLVGSLEDAEDIAQDSFVLAFRCVSRYDGARSFLHWLIGIARNRAKDLRRQQARGFGGQRDLVCECASPGVEELDEVPDPDPTPHERWVVQESEAWIVEQISELPEKYQAVSRLCWLEDLTPGQIGERLGLDTGAVRVRLHRARKWLRTRLEEKRGWKRVVSE